MDQAKTIALLSESIKEIFPEAADLLITQDTVLDDIPGWDSMAAVNLQTKLAEVFGITIPEEMLSGETSIDEILSQIASG